MTELEKVEKLREKADVSFADAKEALDATDGDILDALIYLENQGKAIVPAGGGFFSAASSPEPKKSNTAKNEARSEKKGESFSDMMRRFGNFMLTLLRKGNRNFLDATKGDQPLFTIPVTAVALLLLLGFWISIPLFIGSLFCGVRYRFRGEDLGTDSVNRVLNNATDVVEEVKSSLSDRDKENDKTAGKDNSDDNSNDDDDGDSEGEGD